MLQSKFEHLKGISCATISMSLCTTEKREDAIFIHQSKNVWIQGEQWTSQKESESDELRFYLYIFIKIQ